MPNIAITFDLYNFHNSKTQHSKNSTSGIEKRKLKLAYEISKSANSRTIRIGFIDTKPSNVTKICEPTDAISCANLAFNLTTFSEVEKEVIIIRLAVYTQQSLR
jgi:negative regulator of replication initiation